MTTWSVGILRPLKDIMAWEVTILQPTIENILFSLDKEWVEKHYPEAGPLAPKPAQAIDAAKFVDDSGNVRTSIRALVQDHVRKLNDVGRTQLEFMFTEETYMTGINSENNAGVLVDIVKIVKITATVDIVKTIIQFPMFSDPTATYLLKNAIEENDCRYALIDENRPELKAQVSLHPGVLTMSSGRSA
jgi:hypothetical protein